MFLSGTHDTNSTRFTEILKILTYILYIVTYNIYCYGDSEARMFPEKNKWFSLFYAEYNHFDIIRYFSRVFSVILEGFNIGIICLFTDCMLPDLGDRLG